MGNVERHKRPHGLSKARPGRQVPPEDQRQSPRSGDGQRSVLSWILDRGHRGWAEHMARDPPAPPPRSNATPCDVPNCPISLVCTSHGAQFADLPRHVFGTHCSEPAGDKTQPTGRGVLSRCFGRKGDGAAWMGGSETGSWS